MKKLLIATAALAMVSTPAFAQQSSDSGSFTINGTVDPECTMETPADVNFGTLAVDLTAGANALTFEDNKDETQQIWLSCNAQASITMQSTNGGLIGSNAPTDPQFSNKLNQTISLTDAQGTALSLGYKAGLHKLNPRSVNSVAEFHTLADLRVRIEGNEQGNQNQRLVAGDYTDTMTITITII